MDGTSRSSRRASATAFTSSKPVVGVAAADGGVLGARRSPLEEIRGNIRAAGLTAVERNGRFERTGGDGARG